MCQLHLKIKLKLKSKLMKEILTLHKDGEQLLATLMTKKVGKDCGLESVLIKT